MVFVRRKQKPDKTQLSRDPDQIDRSNTTPYRILINPAALNEIRDILNDLGVIIRAKAEPSCVRR